MNAPQPVNRASVRHAVSVQVANLDEGERDLLNTLVAVLTDPALAGARRKLMDGDLALALEGGEVVWIDPKAGEEAFPA